MTPRDALEPGPLGPDGEPTFPNLPRKPDGSPDWDRLGGEHSWRDRGGRVIDPKPSIPHPTTGEPTRPE